MTQAFYDGFPWTIHRNKRGWPRWWQRWYEAWLVVTGRYTFWHAYDQGRHNGSADEYRRIVINGGDLTPLLCAAVDELKPGDMSELQHGKLRAAIWARYSQTPGAPAERPSVSNGVRGGAA